MIKIGFDTNNVKGSNLSGRGSTSMNTVTKTRWRKVASVISHSRGRLCMQTAATGLVMKKILTTSTTTLVSRGPILQAAVKSLHPRRTSSDLRRK